MVGLPFDPSRGELTHKKTVSKLNESKNIWRELALIIRNFSYAYKKIFMLT